MHSDERARLIARGRPRNLNLTALRSCRWAIRMSENPSAGKLRGGTLKRLFGLTTLHRGLHGREHFSLVAVSGRLRP